MSICSSSHRGIPKTACKWIVDYFKTELGTDSVKGLAEVLKTPRGNQSSDKGTDSAQKGKIQSGFCTPYSVRDSQLTLSSNRSCIMHLGSHSTWTYQSCTMHLGFEKCMNLLCEAKRVPLESEDRSKAVQRPPEQVLAPSIDSYGEERIEQQQQRQLSQQQQLSLLQGVEACDPFTRVALCNRTCTDT